MSTPRRSEPLNANQIDFRALYYNLRERSWIIALCLVVAGLGAAAYLMRAPKIYAAKVVLQVEQNEQKILKIENVQQDDARSLEFLKTVEQTLQNRALLERVLDTNHLATNPRFVKSQPDRPPLTRDQLVSKLALMVEAKLRKGTRLIDLKVEHTDPQLASLIANSLVGEFLTAGHEYNVSATELAGSFLMNEEKRLKEKLQQSELATQNYKEQTGNVSLEERQNVVVEKLKEFSQKVTEAKSQRILQETAYNQARLLATNPAALMFLPAVSTDANILDIRGNIGRMESELANVRQRYREKHPRYIQTASQLAEWKITLTNTVLNFPQIIRSLYESAQNTEKSLEAALREQETTALALNKQSLVYNSLAREVESDLALYQSVLNRIKETTVTKEIKPNSVRVVQHATAPERPVKPVPAMVSGLALFAGLGGGVFLALFLNAMDRSFKTVDQAEEYLQVPVLAAIPKFNGTVTDQRKLITDDDADSAESEAFRTLRTALGMLGKKEDRRVSLFTSAVPSEGKTFTSINYSLSLAQQGLRTVIIDCDLRRPMVEKTLINEREQGVGVTDYLTGKKDFQSVVHTTGEENFFYIPAGSRTPNPAELLSQRGLDGLIDEALLHFDRVIVDSAPIHAVSDTLLILNRIQTLCLVVRCRRTPRNSVQRAVQILQEADAPLAGIILNMIPRAKGGYGYYYDSYYSYSYYGDYGYGDKDGKKAKKKIKKTPAPEKAAA